MACFVAIVLAALSLGCMEEGGRMEVVIENPTASLTSSAPAIVTISCDATNKGWDGTVTIRGAVYQTENGKKKEMDSCEEDIHLNYLEVSRISFDLEIDPSLGLDYTYEFEVKNQNPDRED